MGLDFRCGLLCFKSLSPRLEILIGFRVEKQRDNLEIATNKLGKGKTSEAK